MVLIETVLEKNPKLRFAQYFSLQGLRAKSRLLLCIKLQLSDIDTSQDLLFSFCDEHEHGEHNIQLSCWEKREIRLQADADSEGKEHQGRSTDQSTSGCRRERSARQGIVTQVSSSLGDDPAST
jgi:hypothetical protein